MGLKVKEEFKDNAKKFSDAIYPLNQAEVVQWLELDKMTVSNWCKAKTRVNKTILNAVSRCNIVKYLKNNEKAYNRLVRLSKTEKKAKELLRAVDGE
jgi:hypothetical protein